MDLTSLTVQIAALGGCLWAESFFPLFMDRRGKIRWVHVARNVAVGLMNGLVLTVGFSGLIRFSAQWGELHRFGLIPRLGLFPAAELAAGFVAFDLWMYGWHRANHAIPLLWRFHRTHHTDPALDTSSAYRFHLGEMVLSTLLRLLVIPLLGIRLQNLVLY
ncbi:MAG: sterol desaturase family protein, partial [Candidatus Omnitrophica bacterium]|nr:sterol desaturase family protein [Candidatus Omnitrophota bacterium]